jgi:uncharacterized protein DUF3806
MEITRQKAVDLLDSLAEFYPIPRAGIDVASTIAANAQRAQIEADRQFSISLTIDDTGVKALRQLLSALHRAMLPGRVARMFGAQIPFTSSVLIANVFGAVLGEALRARVGGEWRLVEVNQQTLVALCSDKGNQCFPTYKAGKQFVNGDEDDIWVFYSVMVQKLAPASARAILTIGTEDLKDPAEYAREWAEVFKNARPSQN